MDIGELMIACGSEVRRAEDAVERMCVSYGCPKDRVNVFIITNNMQATIQDPTGKIHTHIRRMYRSDVNFDRLDYLNDLCRYVCAETPPVAEVQRRIEEVMERPGPSLLLLYCGVALLTAGFALFFGGSWQDALAGAVMGILMMSVKHIIARVEENELVLSFVTSLTGGIAALLMVAFGLGEDHNIIMISGIMLLIPGIAVLNSIRDMIIGDIATGALRLMNAVLVAASIAGGFALAIFVLGGAL